MGRPGTYCHQRRNTEMELLWSTVFVGSVRHTVRQKKSFQLCGCVHTRKDTAKCTRKKETAGSQSWITCPTFMVLKRTQIILVSEASVKMVDGICLMLTDRRVEYSHSRSVSEYIRHFCVCHTHCGSFFLFVGKT